MLMKHVGKFKNIRKRMKVARRGSNTIRKHISLHDPSLHLAMNNNGSIIYICSGTNVFA